ncbi:Carboxylesterase (plasmid) [Neorhizobium galegae bv. officinalis bv. officinalis str. HAMBI 1141]|uniref:Carboxylesterase n=1 Tax=Neorhizobium galegae bv. officinalis bv. officinalis str. HAMBI 1141 TaxID=1028801 RepID=A0A068TIZ1_NEOGA|nr:carboxylesterase family protein [Neorhizobium galegae]CDN57465.1 Carboxylesterase [Neorhizobium galegae bv. officinalis bv. officinalis str. HAMBI 1141]
MLVETTAGTIEGFNENGYAVFLGIPYAAPITPERRFAAPQPVSPWSGIRSAKALSEVCPQIPTYGPVGKAAASTLEFGADFLTVNIRTPSVTGSAPVLVWIHGGGYAVGSANEAVLQSGAFAASGLVEVTVNYRLGALGFLHLNDGSPDNRGLLDQIAALEWVRDNISAFGGDPKQVTFAGRSAGGFSIAAVMAMPAADGLFCKAMLQSGASTGVSTIDDAQKLNRRMLDYLNVTEAELAAVPFEKLLIAQRDLCNQSYEKHDFERDGSASMLGVPFVPVVDGVSLPDHPEDAAAREKTAGVPMMIGCTTGEYVTHATAQPEMDFELAARLLHQRVLPLGLTGVEVVRRYCEALPQHTARGIWRAVGGDLVFQNPATRFARLHAVHQPVYKYLYGPVEPDELGAPHGAEVGEVWYRQGMDVSHLPARQSVKDRTFATVVHDVWVSFICDAAPETPAGRWPRYSGANPQVLHMEKGVFRLSIDPFDGRTALWERPPA